MLSTSSRTLKVRILFFGNNWIGWQIAAWLCAQGEGIVGLVLHPPKQRKYAEEIVAGAGVDPSCIFDGSRLEEAEVIAAIKALKPDIGVSALFGYILRREVLELMPAGCINVHPALLPYNKGAYPNVWSIIEESPAGVTIHFIDNGIDTGDIIAQRQVTVEPVDTGETLYRKLERTAVDLFKETWPLVCSGQSPRLPQGKGEGTYHRVQDIEPIDKISLDQTYTAKELINIIRARTFPPYAGAYFRHGRRKIYLRLQLLYEEEIKGKVNRKTNGGK